MSEPVFTSIALGVAGTFASNVVSAAGQSLEETVAGKTLARLGILKPGFDQRFQNALDKAAMSFLDLDDAYKIPSVFHFLNSRALARDIKVMLLDQKGLDAQKILTRLEEHVGVPLRDAPEHWPNQIDPVLLVDRLFKCFENELGSSADQGIAWLSLALAEHGKVLETISERVAEIAATSKVTDLSNPKIENTRFDHKYLKHIANRAERISTPGARELRGINQSLSVAYISLNLKSGAAAEAVRAEEFLQTNRHITIRGPAGSGKTTLLNWLVTKCDPACPDRPDEWAGHIPFIVPLRKVARLHSGPPSIDRFIDYSVDNKLWATPIPEGWLESVVQIEQRAILLLDGVDELPSSRRLEFWDWLESFTNDYPQNRVVVTSRVLPGTSGDGVISEQWNPPRRFVDSQLQDMSDADVTSFVHHWHDSIDHTKLDNDELGSLAEARATLPMKLEDAANRRIRELCNTPLLCAMICVLHWKEEGYLPRYRVEVYERCCDMLIEARDLKRGVNPPPGPIAAMSKSDKEMVLQQLAIEMMRNRDDSDAAADDVYRIEIAKERALEWIAPRVQRFQSSKAREASAVQVLDYLVERTGLLREPATDLIDFPHRTFQEYLAACAAGAESQESMLARQADDDQWHETIMLAAGTSTGGISFGKRLIEKLINRGENHQSAKDRSQRIRKTCFALALGCLENLRQQDEALRESVLSHLGELVPPRSDDDARILSVAGDAAVAHLPFSKWKDESTATVSACARALRLIGTAEANRSLERGYASDRREGVLTEVCKAGSFPLASIPAVADAVKSSGSLPRYVDISDLGLLKNLNGLLSIDFDLTEARNVDHISSLQELTDVTIRGISENSDIMFRLPSGIEKLLIAGRSLPSGDWFTRLTQLKNLVLVQIRGQDCCRVLERIEGLVDLELVGSDFSQTHIIGGLHDLKSVRLFNLHNVCDLESLQSHPSLRRVSIQSCRDLTSLNLAKLPGALATFEIDQPERGCTLMGELYVRSALENLWLRSVQFEGLEQFRTASGLKSLDVSNCSCSSLDNLDEFAELKDIELSYLDLPGAVILPRSVERFAAESLHAVTTETFRYGAHRLRELEVDRCINIDKLDFIKDCPELYRLRISNLPRLAGLSGVEDASLEALTIVNCDGVDDLSYLRRTPLENISLVSLDGLVDVSPLADLSNLKKLTLVNCDGIRSLEFALDLPKLDTIRIAGMRPDLNIPEALRPKIVHSPHSRMMYFHHRGPWRREVPWQYIDYETGLPIYRRHLPHGAFSTRAMRSWRNGHVANEYFTP